MGGRSKARASSAVSPPAAGPSRPPRCQRPPPRGRAPAGRPTLFQVSAGQARSLFVRSAWNTGSRGARSGWPVTSVIHQHPVRLRHSRMQQRGWSSDQHAAALASSASASGGEAAVRHPTGSTIASWALRPSCRMAAPCARGSAHRSEELWPMCISRAGRYEEGRLAAGPPRRRLMVAYGVGPVYRKMNRPKSRSLASTIRLPVWSSARATPQKLLPAGSM
jgi:hypothetical protein